MDRSSPTPGRDIRRDTRAALVVSGVLTPGLLLVHGLREARSRSSPSPLAAALVVVRALWAAEGRIRASETALKQAQQLAQLGSWSWDLFGGSNAVRRN